MTIPADLDHVSWIVDQFHSTNLSRAVLADDMMPMGFSSFAANSTDSNLVRIS
jgi:hypothetical protein